LAACSSGGILACLSSALASRIAADFAGAAVGLIWSDRPTDSKTLDWHLALTRWIFQALVHLFKLLFRWQGKGTPPEADRQQERLTEILTRLEVLKQEQDALLQEVKSILAVKELG
jgi:hypothetical protein